MDKDKEMDDKIFKLPPPTKKDYDDLLKNCGYNKEEVDWIWRRPPYKKLRERQLRKLYFDIPLNIPDLAKDEDKR